MAGPSTSATAQDPLTVQKLSIQLLDPIRTEDYIKQAPSFDRQVERTLTDNIRLIVEVYNHLLTQREKRPIPEEELLKFYSGQPTLPFHFECHIYLRTTTPKTRLTTRIERTSITEQKLPRKVNTVFLLFYFRTEPRSEIFAITSGWAWEIVRPCVNYQFPKHVAMRILDPQRITKIVRRCLVGSNTQEILVHPPGHELYKTSSLYYLVESFVAEIKNNSSLHYIFSEEFPKYITISTGLLRIEKEISLEKHPPILDLVSKYDRGVETRRQYVIECDDGDKLIMNDGEIEIPDIQFEFLNFLQEVPELASTLNDRLVQLLIKELSENRLSIHLYFKHLDDFLNGSDFKIQREQRKHYESLSDHSPSIETIVEHFQPLLTQQASSSNQENPFTPFYSLFMNGSLRFTTPSGEQQTEKLINCLEGEIKYGGQSYFKIRGMWYLLRADYHTLLQQDFKQLLKTRLLSREKCRELLPHSWDEAAAASSSSSGGKVKMEEKYNRLYLPFGVGNTPFYGPEEGYLVFDQVLPFNIEPCDILRYTPTKTYLIHVKADFGQQTRDVCSQILNSAKMLRSTSLHQRDSFLSQLWTRATKAEETEEFRQLLRRQLESLGKVAFDHLFLERQLIFVYAYVPRKPNLHLESTLPTYIASDRLKGIEGVKHKPEDLLRELQQSEYLDNMGRLTSKFYTTTQKEFCHQFSIKYQSKEITKKAKGNIYRRLSAMATTSDSTLAKLDVLQLAKEIKDLGFELKICEIQPTHSTTSTEDDVPTTSSTSIGFNGYLSSSSTSIKLEDSKIPHLPQSDAFIFLHQGVRYQRKYFTRGDGACGIHALYGTKTNGEYVYNPNKSNDWDHIQLKAKEACAQFLCDYFNFNPTSKQQLFSSIDDALIETEEYKAYIATFDQQKKSTLDVLQSKFTPILFNEYKEFFAQSFDIQSITMLEQILNSGTDISLPFKNFFDENFDDIQKNLSQIEKWTEIFSLKNHLLDIERNRESGRQQFISSAIGFNLYLREMMKSSYYLNRDEINLLSKGLRNKVLIFYDRNQEPIIINPDATGEIIAIEHSFAYSPLERHFSRLERLDG